MSNLDIDVTFSHHDDPAFCLEEKEETLDDEEKEEAFWEAQTDEDAEEDSNESFPEDLTLWLPSYLGASYLKTAGLKDLIKEELQLGRSSPNTTSAPATSFTD